MRKNFLVLTAFLILMVSMATPSFAQLRKDVGSCKGKIESILHSSQEIMVNEYSTGASRTFQVSPSDLATLENGNEVIVIFKKESSNVARAVKVIGKKEVRATAYPKSDNVSDSSTTTAPTKVLPSVKVSSTATTVPSTKSSTKTTSEPSASPKMSY